MIDYYSVNGTMPHVDPATSAYSVTCSCNKIRVYERAVTATKPSIAKNMSIELDQGGQQRMQFVVS
jgi:hypothetical protein